VYEAPALDHADDGAAAALFARVKIFSVLLTAEMPLFAQRARSQNVIEPPGAMEISPPPKETMH